MGSGGVAERGLAMQPAGRPTLVSFPRLVLLLAAVDARRGASWLAAGAVAGLPLLCQGPPDLLLPLAWAYGAVLAVVAAGDLPVAVGLGSQPSQRVTLPVAWMLERMAWPLLGLLVAFGWGGMRIATLMAAAGCVVASLLLAVCRWRRCSASDAASGTLLVTLAALLVGMAMPPALRGSGVAVAGSWAAVAVGLLAVVGQSDRRSTLAREAATGNGPLGDSELRRWYLRLTMVGTLLGMVRWLFAAEPLVGLYGLICCLLVAGLVLPDAVLARAGATCGCWRQLARVAGSRPPLWRQVQPWLLPAVVALWPLLVAVVLVPAARAATAVLAGLAVAVVVAAAGACRWLVAHRWLERETALALPLTLVWLAAIVVLSGGAGDGGSLAR